jgi:hypothetical protein
MKDRILLYSINTLLAYRINQKFYHGLHYVWCCPYFNTKSANPYDLNVARSSLPAEIYSEILKDIKGNDLHSEKIKQNKVGLLNGSVEKFKQGVISDDEKTLIQGIVSKAELSDFTPLIYVTPVELVKNLVEPVELSERASLFSPEIKIKELPRQLFDIIDFG